MTRLPPMTLWAPRGAKGSTLWKMKTFSDIMADCNFILSKEWEFGSCARMPGEIYIPPSRLVFLQQQVGLLEYLILNSVTNHVNPHDLKILPDGMRSETMDQVSSLTVDRFILLGI